MKVLTIIPALLPLTKAVQGVSGYQSPLDIRVGGSLLLHHIMLSVVKGLQQTPEVKEIRFLILGSENDLSYLNHTELGRHEAVFSVAFQESIRQAGMEHVSVKLEAIWPGPNLGTLMSRNMLDCVQSVGQTCFFTGELIKEADLVFIHAADTLTCGPASIEFFANNSDPEPYYNHPTLFCVPPTGDPENWTLYQYDRFSHFYELLADRKSDPARKWSPLVSEDQLVGFTGIAAVPKSFFEPEAPRLDPFNRHRVGLAYPNVMTSDQLEDSGLPSYRLWAPEVYDSDENQFYDFGHPLPLIQSRLQFSEARSHNQLVVDLNTSLVTKTSSAKEFPYQCRWFQEAEVRGLPRRYLPQTSCSVSSQDGVVPEFTLEMELLAGSSLADLALNNSLSEYEWRVAGRRVQQVFRDLMSISYAEEFDNPEEALLLRCNEMYLVKTLDRLKSIPKDLLAVDKTGSLTAGLVTISSSLRQYVQSLCLPRTGIERDYAHTFVHGDLCFSNIIYHPESRGTKLIDPRGLFGGTPTDVGFSVVGESEHELNLGHRQMAPFSSGDPAYDLAKLIHSFKYGYEFILEDRVRTNAKNSFLSADIQRKMQAFEQELMTDLSEEFPVMVSRAMAITPLLFVSMVPLHSNRPDRQLTLLQMGVQMYKHILDSGNK